MQRAKLYALCSGNVKPEGQRGYLGLAFGQALVLRAGGLGPSVFVRSSWGCLYLGLMASAPEKGISLHGIML